MGSKLAESEWEVVSGFVSHERGLRALGDSLRLDGLSSAAAEQIVNCVLAIKKIAAGLEVTLAARAAESGSWKARGAASPEEDLARRAGTSTGEAKETLATSKKLPSQPKLANALRNGKLSQRQANEISSAAAVNPAAEGDLVETAGTADLRGLRDECRKARAAADPDPEATNRRIHASRFFRHGYDTEGAFTGSFRVAPQLGARFESLLGPFRDAAHHQARHEGRREPFEALDADALMAMAEASQQPVPSSSSARHQVHVLVDHDALVRGHTQAGETCEMSGVTVPVSVVHDILDDAFLVGLFLKGVEVAKVRRFGRRIPAAVRDALRVRDHGTCTVEGCSRNAYLEIDHKQPYAKGGPTALDNLQLLCLKHHRNKTATDRLFEPDPDPGPDPPDTG